ncbi:MAG: nitroreductase family protein [Acholeplasmataceae bacterium]
MSNPVIENMKDRRSIRRFKTEQIKKEELDEIILAGRIAPSGKNVQQNHFIVIQNEDVKKTVRRLVEDAYAAIGTDHPSYPRLERAIARARKHDYDFFFSAPTLIVLANHQNNENAMADVAVALENMMLAATSLSVGSCYINQFKRVSEDPDLFAYFQKLGLGPDERIFGALSLGYSALPWPERKEITGNRVTFHR